MEAQLAQAVEQLRQELRAAVDALRGEASQYQDQVSSRLTEASDVVAQLGQALASMKKSDVDMKPIVNTKGMMAPSPLQGSPDYKGWVKRFVAFQAFTTQSGRRSSRTWRSTGGMR